MKTEIIKHTQGPWKYERYPKSISNLRGVINSEKINICGVSERHIGTNECDANARLISAAPELLKAAKNLLLRESELTESHDWLEYRALENAVNKAEGRE